MESNLGDRTLGEIAKNVTAKGVATVEASQNCPNPGLGAGFGEAFYSSCSRAGLLTRIGLYPAYIPLFWLQEIP